MLVNALAIQLAFFTVTVRCKFMLAQAH